MPDEQIGVQGQAGPGVEGQIAVAPGEEAGAPVGGDGYVSQFYYYYAS